MQEITNEVYLQCVRTATAIVEECSLDQVNSSIMKFDESTKRSILSQKLAKEIFDGFTDAKTVEKELTEEG